LLRINIMDKNFCFYINTENIKNLLKAYIPIIEGEEMSEKKCDYKVFINKISSKAIIEDNILSINPSNFYFFADGRFAVDYGHSLVVYDIFNKPGNIYIYIKESSFLRKFLSMEFKSNLENISQIFYELVVIPLIFFDTNKFPLHASAVYLNNLEKAVLFGGTGGVGKTSLEILFSEDKNAYFLADDISVIDNTGFTYPNLAFPKIYGYNVNNRRNLFNRIMKNESLFSKFHWFFHYYVRGPKKVRRKISPYELFSGRVRTEKAKIGYYIILFKTNKAKKLEIQNISLESAINTSIEIMKNEYFSFLKFVNWYNVNSELLGFRKRLNTNLEFANAILKAGLSKTNTLLLQIPISYTHKEFIENVRLLLKEIFY